MSRVKEQWGSGQFAIVHRGVWRNPEEGCPYKDVAVKCLKEGASEDQRICFLREAAIMGQFDHPNILQILAIAYNEDMEVRFYGVRRN
jgi:serine/threonine protein kinase